jgi:hypothetical protein
VEEPDAFGLKQVADDPRQTPAENELPDDVAVAPEVDDLQKRLAVGVALFQRLSVLALFKDEARDLLSEASSVSLLKTPLSLM